MPVQRPRWPYLIGYGEPPGYCERYPATLGVHINHPMALGSRLWRFHQAPLSVMAVNVHVELEMFVPAALKKSTLSW